MLTVMHKPTHEENLSQPLQTSNSNFEVEVTFLTTYNLFLKFDSKNNEIFFLSEFEWAEVNVFTIPPGAYELESFKKIKRSFFDEGYSTKELFPFTI